MAYVDLNPIRAQIAETPEESEFTSVHDRASAKQARTLLAAAAEVVKTTRQQNDLLEQARHDSRRDAWLSPMHAGMGAPSGENTGGEADKLACLPITLEHYLSLVDWTGRELRQEKRGRIPEHLLPLLKRLDVDAEHWLDTMERYGSLFWQVVGKVESLLKVTKRLGKAWLRGIRASAHAFSASPASPPG